MSTLTVHLGAALSSLPASRTRSIFSHLEGRVTSGAQSSKASSFSLCFFLQKAFVILESHIVSYNYHIVSYIVIYSLYSLCYG